MEPGSAPPGQAGEGRRSKRADCFGGGARIEERKALCAVIKATTGGVCWGAEASSFLGPLTGAPTQRPASPRSSSCLVTEQASRRGSQGGKGRGRLGVHYITIKGTGVFFFFFVFVCFYFVNTLITRLLIIVFFLHK